MTTQIHECHPHDTKEQLYDVRLHDIQLQPSHIIVLLPNCDYRIISVHRKDGIVAVGCMTTTALAKALPTVMIAYLTNGRKTINQKYK